jgi:hypothetical protein
MERGEAALHCLPISYLGLLDIGDAWQAQPFMSSIIFIHVTRSSISTHDVDSGEYFKYLQVTPQLRCHERRAA